MHAVPDCDLMYLYGYNLYTKCDKVYKYNLKDYPHF